MAGIVVPWGCRSRPMTLSCLDIPPAFAVVVLFAALLLRLGPVRRSVFGVCLVRLRGRTLTLRHRDLLCVGDGMTRHCRSPAEAMKALAGERRGDVRPLL